MLLCLLKFYEAKVGKRMWFEMKYQAGLKWPRNGNGKCSARELFVQSNDVVFP